MIVTTFSNTSNCGEGDSEYSATIYQDEVASVITFHISKRVITHTMKYEKPVDALAYIESLIEEWEDENTGGE